MVENFLRFSILSFAICYAAGECLESAQYQCMTPVNADAELHWSVFGTRVDFALAVHTSGFVALGFTTTPGTMYDTEVVAAVESSTPGVLSAETYRIDDFRGVTADPNINVYDAEVEVEVAEGITTLRFSRDADNGGAYTLDLDGPNDLVWSYHIEDTTIGYHGETRGALVLDLSLSPSQPVCLESDQQHQCMSPVNADAELHWSVFGTRVDFALAVHTSGFVALGFTMTPGTMYDTEVVAAVESSSGVLSAETYRIDDFRGVTADSSINVYDTEVEVEVEEGVTTTILRFSRDADNGGAYTLNLDGPNDLVWSYHIADPTIGYHGETRGALVLDLSLAPAPPQFTQDRYRFTFIGGRRIVGEVVGAVVATSEDGGAISYSLNRSKYEIDSNGVITAVKRQRPGRYRMEVEACGDGGCSTANVKLVILEKNGCLEDFCPPLE